MSTQILEQESGLEKMIVRIGDIEIGQGRKPVIIAGPCAIENKDMLEETAEAVRIAGADMLRGGAYKPRTKRKSFQGLGELGLIYLVEARKQTGLPIVTEIVDKDDISLFLKYDIDVLQIGARNMQNYKLLAAVGARTSKPVLLKRGLFTELDEFVGAAEYIGGERQDRGLKDNVILCLRGQRISRRKGARCRSDYDDLPELRKMTNYPIIFDPSHAVGNGKKNRDPKLIREQVMKAAKAALYMGVDGLIIEVHYNPEEAKCDGHQSLHPEQFEKFMQDISHLRKNKRPKQKPIPAKTYQAAW